MSHNTNERTGTKRTLIDEGTEIKGNMSSSCPIVVMGKIEGEISGPSMEIAESGFVSGRIKVKELRSRGELAGELEAESVELSGRVRDQAVIRAQSLEVSTVAGADMVHFGECELSIGDQPDKQLAIEEATGGGRKSEDARERPRESDRGTAQPAPAATSAAANDEGTPANDSPPSEEPPTSDRRREHNTNSVRVVPDGAIETDQNSVRQ